MSLDVSRLVLVRGSNHPGKGFSIMEAVALAAGEAWSERPRCASPAITEWMLSWNDGLDDVTRQSLRRYIWRLVGSRGSRAEERTRQWMVADWLVRWYAPGWLAAAGLRGHAARLTRLAPIRSAADAAAVWPTVRAASRAARAERDLAWRSAAAVVAAHDWGTAGAVWSAISDATWGVAGSPARAVVWSTADPTAPGRVEEPVWDAACDAAADAAGAIAWVAVRNAAREVAAARSAEVVEVPEVADVTELVVVPELVLAGGGVPSPAAATPWHHSHDHEDGDGREPDSCRVCTAEAIRVADVQDITEVPEPVEAPEPEEPDDLWSLAWETAGVALGPTRAEIQAKAHALVDRLLAVTE